MVNILLLRAGDTKMKRIELDVEAFAQLARECQVGPIQIQVMFPNGKIEQYWPHELLVEPFSLEKTR